MRETKTPNACGRCAHDTAGAYSEYNMWLQAGELAPIPPVHIAADDGIPGIAADELALGLERLYGPGILASQAQDAAHRIDLKLDSSLPAEGYRLASGGQGNQISGSDANGLLYGVFRFLIRLGAGGTIHTVTEESAPAVPRRVINHWDNVDGGVERGYAGKSIFFRGGALCFDAQRIRDYARFLASVGINVVVINNVNVTPASSKLIGEQMLPQVAQLAAIFRPYGIRISLSVHFESPVMLGGLTSSDPLDDRVAAWWREQTEAIYRLIPDFSGYLVKADSEFRGGPHAIGRTQAEGANVLARALAPHGGVVYWRCFIYNCLQDWRDFNTDRPKAAYEIFKALDGQFDGNVILQIKNGPSDFQIREPISPLLGNLNHTRQALELQISQEYTGQQIDLFNLAVLWQEVLESPVDEGLRLQALIGRQIDTVAAVSNIGDDANWTGHTLAQANLYAYGRLAWNPFLQAQEIALEWARLTFGQNERVVRTLSDMLLRSRHTFEKYCTPLGLGWMVNVHTHYGPSPEGYEFMKWGTYHRADMRAIGVDRTRKGTGMTAQYRPALAKLYDNIDTCPQELLLFFHRVPYDHVLQNGETLLQYIYDTHFEGVEEVEAFISTWEDLRDLLPQAAYLSVRERLTRQLENAREWRDVVNTYFYRKTHIEDEQGRTIYP